jgi:serine/threonine-protein kinase
MSRVYRALDEKLDRPVALKLLPRALDPLTRESLEATAALDHPGILRPIEMGTLEGSRYLVLPLVEGTSLHEILRPEAAPSPALSAARGALLLALRGASAAAAHAHLAGVVHRDLKPANILVTLEGRVVVIDWGIACRAGRRRAEQDGLGNVLVGTPYFMAPEQLRRQEITPRVDVFALGTILYMILTGIHPAGEGGGIHDIADRVLHRVPRRPSAIAEDVPPALDEAAMRALEKEPSRRFGDAGELLEALEEAPSGL